MKIGVFDSGIGGDAIANVLRRDFPHADITSKRDLLHLPYGNKSPEEIREFTDAIVSQLIPSDIIVIACNSATTAAIEWLREKYPQQKFIGIEPMVKPATSATRTNIIAVCATPATLQSDRYQVLKNTYGKDVRIIEPDCSTWAAMIEDSTLSEAHIRSTITACLNDGADVIVLGCTHYHWIQDDIRAICEDRAIVIEPSDAISARVRELLSL